MVTFFYRYMTLVFAGFMMMTSQAFAQETGYTEIERELHYLIKLWPGDYDNQEQVSFDARAKDEKPAEQARFHSFFKRVDIPALGEYILYSEEHADADSNQIHQQRLYVLSADENEKAVRVKSYRFKKSSKIRHPYGFDKSALKIAQRDLIRLEECDYLIRRDGYEYVGTMSSIKCDDGQGEGFLQRKLRISDNHYAFQERRVNEDGDVLSAINDYVPRNMRRARWFACMIDVPRTTPNVSNHTQHYMKIYDQGGSFDFTHPDGREMQLIMRNTWSYGMQRETFFIGVFENTDPQKLLVYGWGQPGADRIGINPGYVRIQCDLDTPENVRLQKNLRSGS